MVNLAIREPEDKRRINVREPAEMRWWAENLGSNVATLRQAVDEVGATAQAVERWLHLQRQVRSRLTGCQAARAWS